MTMLDWHVASLSLSFFNINLFLAELGLHRCPRLSLVVASGDSSVVVVCMLFISVASSLRSTGSRRVSFSSGGT